MAVYIVSSTTIKEAAINWFSFPRGDALSSSIKLQCSNHHAELKCELVICYEEYVAFMEGRREGRTVTEIYGVD